MRSKTEGNNCVTVGEKYNVVTNFDAEQHQNCTRFIKKWLVINKSYKHVYYGKTS